MRIKETLISDGIVPPAMRALTCAVLGAVAALLLSVPTVRPTPVEAAQNGGVAAKRGEAIFKQRCVACHNKQPGDTTPFGPPNLNGIFRGPTAITTRDAAVIITNGKGQMPGWGKILTKSDINDLLAYLKTLSPADAGAK